MKTDTEALGHRYEERDMNGWMVCANQGCDVLFGGFRSWKYPKEMRPHYDNMPACTGIAKETP